MTVPSQKPERIAKIMAAHGLCSRRDAERWIVEGRVQVNGQVLDSPAFTVTDEDTIVVDGKTLKRIEPVRLWAFHKPRRVLTTHVDPEGRQTLFSLLPADMPRVISVGRLDMMSEGLILLTTSGELARYLEHPSSNLPRTYRVRVYGAVAEEDIQAMGEGLEIDGVRYKPIKAKVSKDSGANTWIEMTLSEGKNREIRNILSYFGHSINRLIRTGYGPFSLGELPPAGLKEFKEVQFRSFLNKPVF